MKAVLGIAVCLGALLLADVVAHYFGEPDPGFFSGSVLLLGGMLAGAMIPRSAI